MVKKPITQTQDQELLQVQTLSPQQLLAVQLLEMTTVEIEERVRGEVMDNPALESQERDELPAERDELPSDEGLSVDEYDDYSGNGEIPVAYGGYGGGADYPVGDTPSFGDTLTEQLSELPLTSVQKVIGEYIIGSLDEDGLLRKPIVEIEDELLIYNNLAVSADEILDVLKMIQTFEPAGIGARSLQECLLLQLERNGKNRDLSLQKRIVADYYDDFAGKRWD